MLRQVQGKLLMQILFVRELESRGATDVLPQEQQDWQRAQGRRAIRQSHLRYASITHSSTDSGDSTKPGAKNASSGGRTQVRRVIKNTYLAGNDIKEILSPSGDYVFCCAFCVKTAGCKAYTLYTYENAYVWRCVLKFAVGGCVRLTGKLMGVISAIVTAPLTT